MADLPRHFWMQVSFHIFLHFQEVKNLDNRLASSFGLALPWEMMGLTRDVTICKFLIYTFDWQTMSSDRYLF